MAGFVRSLFPLWRLFLGGSFVRCCAVCLCCLCVWAVGGAAVRLFVCAVTFCSVRFSEFLNLRFARGGAPRSTWKKKVQFHHKSSRGARGFASQIAHISVGNKCHLQSSVSLLHPRHRVFSLLVTESSPSSVSLSLRDHCSTVRLFQFHRRVPTINHDAALHLHSDRPRPLCPSCVCGPPNF